MERRRSRLGRGPIPLCCLPSLLCTRGLCRAHAGPSSLQKPDEVCCRPPPGLAGHLGLWEGPLSIPVDSQLPPPLIFCRGESSGHSTEIVLEDLETDCWGLTWGSEGQPLTVEKETSVSFYAHLLSAVKYV